MSKCSLTITVSWETFTTYSWSFFPVKMATYLKCNLNFYVDFQFVMFKLRTFAQNFTTRKKFFYKYVCTMQNSLKKTLVPSPRKSLLLLLLNLAGPDLVVSCIVEIFFTNFCSGPSQTLIFDTGPVQDGFRSDLVRLKNSGHCRQQPKKNNIWGNNLNDEPPLYIRPEYSIL